MSVITLTTDFGIGSPYIAEMKGAILSISSAVQVVDATHAISPQDVTQGAYAIRQFASAFPVGTVHVAVVDPGVGSSRAILLVASDGQYFVGPDNGLLTFQLVAADDVRRVDRSAFRSKAISKTFHGRDIMCPVAAHLCSGVAIDEIATQFDGEPILLSLPVATKSSGDIVGEIVHIDSFGNLITNVSGQQFLALGSDVRVEICGRSFPRGQTYSDVDRDQALAIVGSGGWLEIAINGGSAHKKLGISLGDAVRVVASR